MEEKKRLQCPSFAFIVNDISPKKIKFHNNVLQVAPQNYPYSFAKSLLEKRPPKKGTMANKLWVWVMQYKKKLTKKLKESNNKIKPPEDNRLQEVRLKGGDVKNLYL